MGHHRATIMLQNAKNLLETESVFYYKMQQGHYKMRQSCCKMQQLFQTATFITKCICAKFNNHNNFSDLLYKKMGYPINFYLNC